MLKTGEWHVEIRVGVDKIWAAVVNRSTGETRYYERVYADYEDGPRYQSHDEAIGECLTHIRDTFDEV